MPFWCPWLSLVSGDTFCLQTGSSFVGGQYLGGLSWCLRAWSFCQLGLGPVEDCINAVFMWDVEIEGLDIMQLWLGYSFLELWCSLIGI